MKEVIVRKLTSRKFWGYLATFVASTIVLFGMAESFGEKIATLIIMLGDTLIYILTEAEIDKAQKGTEQNEE